MAFTSHTTITVQLTHGLKRNLNNFRAHLQVVACLAKTI